jgi:hypothetical protein
MRWLVILLLGVLSGVLTDGRDTVFLFVGAVVGAVVCVIGLYPNIRESSR